MIKKNNEKTKTQEKRKDKIRNKPDNILQTVPIGDYARKIFEQV